MKVEHSRIRLIKSDFESKLLFENPLINDSSIVGLSDEFSENIVNFYNELPKDKTFISQLEFDDSLVIWFDAGKLTASDNPLLSGFVNNDLIIELASSIQELNTPQYISDFFIGERKFDLLLVKEQGSVFGILKEALSHGVLVQLANLTSRVQALERKRLSLDLHDSVTQHLSGIKFLLSALTSRDTENKSIVSKCVSAIDTAINETRMVSRNLMPLKLEEKGFDTVLDELKLRLESHYNVAIVINNEVNFSFYSANFQLAIYRVVQELCSNSIKHGNSSKLTIDFSEKDDCLKFHYTDNGSGFDVQNYNKSRMGMSNIYYRIFQFGGELDVQALKKLGVNYYFTFPINKIEKV